MYILVPGTNNFLGRVGRLLNKDEEGSISETWLRCGIVSVNETVVQEKCLLVRFSQTRDLI